jgi:hypothetical protein
LEPTASLKAEKKGPVEREMLEMRENLADSCKGIMEEEATMGVSCRKEKSVSFSEMGLKKQR